MHPGDESAPADEVINCFPEDTEVSDYGIKKSFRRWYEGNLVCLETFNLAQIRVTPNHPILTIRGWRRAGELTRGDCLIRILSGDYISSPRVEPDKHDIPTTLIEIHNSLSVSQKRKRMAGTSVDFHGDGKTGEVDVVFSDSHLRHGMNAAFCEEFSELGLSISDSILSAFGSDGAQSQGSHPIFCSAPSNISSQSVRPKFLRRKFGVSKELSSRAIPSFNPAFLQSSFNNDAFNSETESNSIFRLASLITADEIINVEVNSVRCFTHNLETTSGWYAAQGYLCRNCHCVAIPTESP